MNQALLTKALEAIRHDFEVFHKVMPECLYDGQPSTPRNRIYDDGMLLLDIISELKIDVIKHAVAASWLKHQEGKNEAQ